MPTRTNADRVVEGGLKESPRIVGDDDPISPIELEETEVAPFWPFGAEGTRRLIRRGHLSAITIGRRRFVTLRTLRECLARHTTTATAGATR